MEQRKRESLIPKGTFDVGPTLDPVDRGDASGTFARMVSEVPAAPIARIELIRQPAAVAAPPAARPVLRTPPPPPPASLRPTSMLPPALASASKVGPSLEALVALTSPPSAPTPSFAEVERVEFPDFGLRLDVPQMAPAPVSLLPLPNERRSDSNRGVARWMLLAALLTTLAVAGWFSRDLVASAPVAAPRATFTSEPVVAAAVTVEPVVAPVVEEVVTAVADEVVVAEAVVTAVADEVVVAEAVVAPVVVESVTAHQPVAPARTVAPTPRAAVPTAALAPTVEPKVDVVEEAPARVLEEVLAEELPETLERAEIIEGIEMLRNEYDACVGDLHGTAEMRIRIGNTGRITYALVEGHYAGTPQGSCLARTLRQARFRPFVRSSIEITYPLAL